MKFFKLLIILLFTNIGIYAAEPLVKVPDLEDNNTLELYEDSEGLFSIKVIQFYRMAVILETQLKLMGIVPKTKVLNPTYEEFEELDKKIIKVYHKIAKSLEEEVLAAPPSDREKLLQQINNLEKSLRDSIAYYLQKQGKELNKFYEVSLDKLKAMNETYLSNLELIQEYYENNCANSYNLLSIAGKGNIFFSNGGNNVRNDVWLSLKTTLNAGRIAGFWKDFNFYYEYLAPKFFTQYDSEDYKEYWTTNAHSVGAGGKIPINVSKNFRHGIGVELGYFWMKGNITNIGGGTVDWDGINFNFEYFAGVPSCRYPFELFVNLGIYHNFSTNLRFFTRYPNYNDINIGKTHMSVSLDIRYNLLNTAFDN